MATAEFQKPEGVHPRTSPETLEQPSRFPLPCGPCGPHGRGDSLGYTVRRAAAALPDGHQAALPGAIIFRPAGALGLARFAPCPGLLSAYPSGAAECRAARGWKRKPGAVTGCAQP